MTTVIFALIFFTLTEKGVPDKIIMEKYESEAECIHVKEVTEQAAKEMGLELLPVMLCQPIALHPKA